MDLSNVDTIVIVIMENRSFDNLLGQLSLPPTSRIDVEGLQIEPAWNEARANSLGDTKFVPFHLTDPYDVIDADPPHERSDIAKQLGALADGKYALSGFVENYAGAKGARCLSAEKPPPVMGYFGGEEAPVTKFLAEEYAICDHWFSALPAGTQPNRLMAMAGVSSIDTNVKILPDQKLVYDWLTKREIKWRVYHQGAPFFSMMPRWIPEIVATDHFRPLELLSADIDNEPPDVFPKVIFIEPTYTDSPHIGTGSDDHAPSAIKGGQKFLLEVYRDLTQDPDLFSQMLAIVTYDEHGGFFDHVSPPLIPTEPPATSNYPVFESLGIRVPAFIISPFVKPGTVFNQVLDHTSILKLLGRKFGTGGSYSKEVDERVVGSVAEVLNWPDSKRRAPAAPSLNDYLAREAPHSGFIPGTVADTPMKEAFQAGLDLIREHQGDGPGKFDALLSQFPSAAERREK